MTFFFFSVSCGCCALVMQVLYAIDSRDVDGSRGKKQIIVFLVNGGRIW